MIPCSNPHAQYGAHKAEIDAAIAAVLDSGSYILGETVAAFEREFAAFVGVAHGIGVGSGTEAIHVALAACGIGPGDEVITVAHTAVATISAIELAGAVPALVDIEPDYFTLNPDLLERAITPRAKAVIPVHVYGQPADMAPILEIAKRRGLKVIEDCAQAHGAAWHGRALGSWGDIACFSFYPTKNLGAIGDGGMVVTNDPELSKRARLVREYGWADRYISAIPGWNSRLDPIQAAILSAKLKWLDADNRSRERLARRYDTGLADAPVTLPRVRPDGRHVYHLYVVRSPQRGRLQAHLEAEGVSTLIHYPVPVHLQPAYRGRLPGGTSLPETERAAGEVLSLPMFPELGEEEVARVCAAVASFDAARA